METNTSPTRIKSIKSNTPITITFNDDNGITLTADSFTFEDAENMQYEKRFINITQKTIKIGRALWKNLSRR